MVYQQPSKKPASDDTTYFSKSSQKEQQESFRGNFAPNQSDERLNGQSLPEYSSRGWDLLKAKFARTRPKDGIQGNQESSEQPEAKLPLQTDQNSESGLSNSDSSKNLEKQVFPADENKALAFKQTNSAHSSTLISQANQSVQPSETEFRFQLILPPDVIQKIQQKQLYGKKLRDELLVLLFMQLEGKSRSLAEFLVNNKLRDWSFYKEPTEKELNLALMAVLVTNPPPGEASQTGSPAGIQKQNSERDAQELRQALQQGSQTEQTVIRILNQPLQIVQQILEIYNSQYNTLSGKGLFVDIKIKLNAIDSEGLERYWEFVVAQFQLAGIYIPPYILQNEKLEKLEYYRQNDTNNNKYFEIVAEPKNTIAATQTQITYSVQVLRDEVFDKKPNYQYQWYILNDPETVKNNPNVPDRYYHEANVGSRWENAEWKYPGNHKVICRVQVNDRPPVYIEYQQTVLPREVVLDESLKKAPIPPDPSQQSILLKNYQKALLNAEQQKGSNSLDPKVKEQLQAQNDELDQKLKSTDGLKRHPIKAIYLSKQGAKTFPLNVFVAQTEDRLGSPWAGRYTWTLVDITNPTDQRMSGEYSGMGHTHQEAIQAAINKWNQNNRYYPGVIKLEVAEAVAGQVIQSEFETDGKNFWDSLSQFLDVIGFVTGIASILTFAIPVLSIPLASVSIAASTAGATIRLVQRRVEERPDPVADTLDILTIVSNVFAGVWLRGANARLNATASTNFNNGILIGQLAVDGSTGVILNTVYLKRYEEIIQIKDPQERTDKLIKLFQEAALSNSLLSLSITSTVKDIDAINRMRNSRETVEIDPSSVENPVTKTPAEIRQSQTIETESSSIPRTTETEIHKVEQAQTRIDSFLGSERIRGLSTDDVRILNLLDDQALNTLAGASNTQILQAVALARKNREGLNFLLHKYGKDLVKQLSTKTFAQYLPNIIEVGGGEGNYSQFLQKEFLREGEEFLATDFAQEAGQGNFLLNAESSAIATRYGIDANRLHELFEPESVRIIVGANPYGSGPKYPGQSYGLSRFTGKGQDTIADNRFLLSAHQVLQPLGKVIIRCKGNIMRRFIAKSTQISNQQKNLLLDQFPKLKATNPYTRVEPEDLLEFSKIGYAITVTSTSPPEGASFGRPDTNPGQGVELSPFNVEITFQKSDTPSVTYIIENEQFVERP